MCILELNGKVIARSNDIKWLKDLGISLRPIYIGELTIKGSNVRHWFF